MWLDQEGLEESFIRFNLPLKLIVLFRAKPRLIWIRNDVIQIDLGAICPQDRSVESALLQFDSI